MIGKIGVDPDKFWRYTVRELSLVANAHQHNNILDWERTRHLDYSIKSSSFIPACMSKKGSVQAFKQIKQPKDLFELPTDINTYRQIVIDKERTIAAVEKAKKIWQKS